MKKKGEFVKKGKAILDQGKPTSMEDFLEPSSQGPTSKKKVVRKSVHPYIRTSVQTEKGETARLEIRINEVLAEALRRYTFDKRTTKKAVIVETLTRELKKAGYLSAD